MVVLLTFSPLPNHLFGAMAKSEEFLSYFIRTFVYLLVPLGKQRQMKEKKKKNYTKKSAWILIRLFGQ